MKEALVQGIISIPFAYKIKGRSIGEIIEKIFNEYNIDYEKFHELSIPTEDGEVHNVKISDTNVEIDNVIEIEENEEDKEENKINKKKVAK